MVRDSLEALPDRGQGSRGTSWEDWRAMSVCMEAGSKHSKPSTARGSMQSECRDGRTRTTACPTSNFSSSSGPASPCLFRGCLAFFGSSDLSERHASPFSQVDCVVFGIPHHPSLPSLPPLFVLSSKRSSRPCPRFSLAIHPWTPLANHLAILDCDPRGPPVNSTASHWLGAGSRSRLQDDRGAAGKLALLRVLSPSPSPSRPFHRFIASTGHSARVPHLLRDLLEDFQKPAGSGKVKFRVSLLR